MTVIALGKLLPNSISLHPFNRLSGKAQLRRLDPEWQNSSGCVVSAEETTPSVQFHSQPPRETCRQPGRHIWVQRDHCYEAC